MSTLYTIGYEGLTPDAFFAQLQKNKIDTLVDVRQLPLSRKKGFSKSQLAALCEINGVRYLGLCGLGCPKDIRDAYKMDKDWKIYTARFLKYLATQDNTVNLLRKVALRETCCLLCFEADHNCCHRLFVANAVVQDIGPSATIHHIRTTSIESPLVASLRAVGK